MNTLFPKKLKKGDLIKIIAPSRSLALISKKNIEIANKRLVSLGLKISFGKNVYSSNEFISSSIEERTQDLHEAFLDKSVKAVISVIGGYNSIELLDRIDWKIIKDNPKIFCGYSDITILNNSIYSKTGLITYYGPHYSSFAEEKMFEYSLDFFKKCLFTNKPYDIKESEFWSDDRWYIDQEKRVPVKNEGYWIINSGNASGDIIGGNLCTFNLLQGTEFFPDLENKIIFIEDDLESNANSFSRDLNSLILQKNFNLAKGIVIGRFQKESKISKEVLVKIVKSKKNLDKIPVIANVDFGHTSPRITFPVGGEVSIESNQQSAKIHISVH